MDKPEDGQPEDDGQLMAVMEMERDVKTGRNAMMKLERVKGIQEAMKDFIDGIREHGLEVGWKTGMDRAEAKARAIMSEIQAEVLGG